MKQFWGSNFCDEAIFAIPMPLLLVCCTACLWTPYLQPSSTSACGIRATPVHACISHTSSSCQPAALAAVPVQAPISGAFPLLGISSARLGARHTGASRGDIGSSVRYCWCSSDVCSACTSIKHFNFTRARLGQSACGIRHGLRPCVQRQHAARRQHVEQCGVSSRGHRDSHWG